MDIQLQENESLAAYTHRFKMEAKRCNFTNDATTIRIFVKGLKNAHSLPTCIYEKANIDHITKIDTAITEAAHGDLSAPTEDRATDLAMTHLTDHITDHLRTEFFQVINPKIIVDHSRNHPICLQGMNCIDHATI